MSRFDIMLGKVSKKKPETIIPLTYTYRFRGEQDKTYRIGFLYNPEDKTLFVGARTFYKDGTFFICRLFPLLPDDLKSKIRWRYSSVIVIYNKNPNIKPQIKTWVFSEKTGEQIIAGGCASCTESFLYPVFCYTIIDIPNDLVLKCFHEDYQQFNIGIETESIWRNSNWKDILIKEAKPLLDTRIDRLGKNLNDIEMKALLAD
jgi:hypothetical protein